MSTTSSNPMQDIIENCTALSDIPEVPFFRRLLVTIAHGLLACLYKTIRVEFRCGPGITPEIAFCGGPHILTMWHGEQLMAPFIVTGPIRKAMGDRARPLVPLVSKHADGRLLAYLLYLLGLRSIGGSSKKGGSEALRRLVRVMRAGASSAITVDGPRGPRHEVKPGAIKLAQLTKAPLVPLIAIPERAYRFRSWDRMYLPLPFSRITFYILSPRFVGPDEDEEAVCRELRTAMLQFHAEVDK